MNGGKNTEHPTQTLSSAMQSTLTALISIVYYTPHIHHINILFTYPTYSHLYQALKNSLGHDKKVLVRSALKSCTSY